LTSVSAVSATSDRDNFRRPSPINPLWQAFDRENLKNIAVAVHEQGAISDDQFRVLYELFSTHILSPAGALPASGKRLILGKLDEVPVEGGLTIENGFILGGSFRRPPTPAIMDAYKRHVDKLINEHPQELAFLLAKKRRNVPELNQRLTDARGGLAVVADTVFSNLSDFEIQQSIALHIENNNLPYILEALFTSNSMRDKIRGYIQMVNSRKILDRTQRETLAYLGKYYVEGDESTGQFKKAVALVAKIIKENPRLNKSLVAMVSQLRYRDPGKLFYAFLRITSPTTPQQPADVPALPLLKTVAPHSRIFEEAI